MEPYSQKSCCLYVSNSSWSIHRDSACKRWKDSTRTSPEPEYRNRQFSPDGKRILSIGLGRLPSGGTDGTIVRCHSLGGKLLWQRDFRISTSKTHTLRCFSDAIFSPDGKWVALRDAFSEKTVLILDAPTGRDIRQFKSSKNQTSNYLIPLALAFSPDGKRIFARGNNAILVWDIE